MIAEAYTSPLADFSNRGGNHLSSCVDCAALGQSDTGGWYLSNLLNTESFPPRWECGEWSALNGWIHIGADIGVFTAYAAIPIALIYFIWKRRDAPFPSVFLLFTAFILSCGLGHLLEAAIFWWPAYRLAGAWKILTAIVSWATVIALIRVLPGALELPGLRTINDELNDQIQRREKVESELRESNKRLEEFASMASHDLQGPLRTLGGLMSVIGDEGEDLDEDARIELALAAHDECLRMDSMVSRLLEYARVGIHARTGEQSSLTEAVEATRRSLDEEFAVSRARVEIRVESLVPLHPTDLQILLQNLFSNSLKYRCQDRHPVVQVHTEQVGHAIRLVVEDNGVGIPEEDRERVFDLFQRSDHTERVQGAGIGLATCQRIVGAYDGQIEISENPRGGAIITVILPMRGNAAAA